MEEIVVCISPKRDELIEFKRLMRNISEGVGSKKALTLPPHITLVHRIHTKDYSNIKKVIKDLIKQIKPFKVVFKKIGFFNDPPIIYMEPEHVSKLVDLHNLLMPKVTQFKDEWVRESFLKLKLNEKQEAYLKKYGSPYVREFFNAHMTLAGPDVNPEKFKKWITQKITIKKCILTIDNIAIMRKKDNKWAIDKRINLETI